RVYVPDFSGLGEASEEQTKQIRKACSRRSLKLLEECAQSAAGRREDLPSLLRSMRWSANRMGVCLSGDPTVAMSLILREESITGPHEPPEALSEALCRSDTLRDLFAFALSEDYFRVRQLLGMSVP